MKAKRYGEIALVFWRHADRDLLERARGDAVELDDVQKPADGNPDELVEDLVELGPTFVKLGQLLSTRPDILPPQYIEALSTLQADVEPFDSDVAIRIVEDELGVSVEKAFEDFEREPIAAASLGQVHRATLRSGRKVVVKVQRPDIRAQIREDLDALDRLCQVIDKHSETARRYGVADSVRHFRRELLRELDYRREADNLKTIRNALSDHDDIVVPEPIDDYTTSRVLTMEFIEGRPVTDLPPVARGEIDTERLARALVKAYLHQILVTGYFHADPHPGNVFITPDQRIGLIDLGMIGRLDPTLREEFMKVINAVTEGEGHEVAKLLRGMSTPQAEADRTQFERDVADLLSGLDHAAVDHLSTGAMLLALARASADAGFPPAPELSIIGKTMLHLEAVVLALDPDFDPRPVIRNQANELMESHLKDAWSPSSLFAMTLEMTEFARRLPGRLNQILDDLTEQRFTINVDALDEKWLMESLQKIANRIATAIVIASLVIGSALFARIDAGPELAGYPALPLVLFVIATLLGIALVIDIARRDWGGPAE